MKPALEINEHGLYRLKKIITPVHMLTSMRYRVDSEADYTQMFILDCQSLALKTRIIIDYLQSMYKQNTVNSFYYMST